jgi:hypothetical protein
VVLFSCVNHVFVSPVSLTFTLLLAFCPFLLYYPRVCLSRFSNVYFIFGILSLSLVLPTVNVIETGETNTWVTQEKRAKCQQQSKRYRNRRDKHVGNRREKDKRPTLAFCPFLLCYPRVCVSRFSNVYFIVGILSFSLVLPTCLSLPFL